MIVFLLLAAQVGFVIYWVAAPDQIEKFFQNAMEDFFGLYYGNDALLANATNAIQHEVSLNFRSLQLKILKFTYKILNYKFMTIVFFIQLYLIS